MLLNNILSGSHVCIFIRFPLLTKINCSERKRRQVIYIHLSVLSRVGLHAVTYSTPEGNGHKRSYIQGHPRSNIYTRYSYLALLAAVLGQVGRLLEIEWNTQQKERTNMNDEAVKSTVHLAYIVYRSSPGPTIDASLTEDNVKNATTNTASQYLSIAIDLYR